MEHNIIQYASLLGIILLVVMIAQKVRIAYPVLLVITGLGLGFVPGLRGMEIKPEIIFVIFLPPLLYEAAWNTSWKDFWKWRRVILTFAFLVVILTSCIIAFVSSSLIPGFTLAAGFLLGGIISPPDAVSATTVLKTIKVPKRIIAILEGESLMNDASSLVIFRFAMAAVTTGTFVFSEAAGNFVLVVVMGVVCGLGVALVFYALHRWLPTTTNIDVILTLLTPYAMYIVAESFKFSGVLAVVSGGLFLSNRRTTFLTNSSRLQGLNVWESVAFILNGLIFILIGLQFPGIVKDLGPQGLAPAIKYSLIITGILILTRLASTYGALFFTMFISKFIKTADDDPGWKAPLIFGWAGMRGVVSLAAALSIPVTLHSGAVFPHRPLILFITFTVILITLVLQGLTLPALIKWVDMEDVDYTISFEQQRQMVRRELAKLSLGILNRKYARQLKENDMVKQIKEQIEVDMELLNDWREEGAAEREDEFYGEYRSIRMELLEEQRNYLSQLNRKEEINDDIVRQQLALLDLEEERVRKHAERSE
jgi:Na+/H+ antiporter